VAPETAHGAEDGERGDKIKSKEAMRFTSEFARQMAHDIIAVDRIVGCNTETERTGVKNIAINKPYSPGHPVMPGML
jgi:3-hydroxymyristoyl/3-hydroxydecanoyl-(acyl carrier protein) dehydratase